MKGGDKLRITDVLHPNHFKSNGVEMIDSIHLVVSSKHCFLFVFVTNPSADGRQRLFCLVVQRMEVLHRITPTICCMCPLALTFLPFRRKIVDARKQQSSNDQPVSCVAKTK